MTDHDNRTDTPLIPQHPMDIQIATLRAGLASERRARVTTAVAGVAALLLLGVTARDSYMQRREVRRLRVMREAEVVIFNACLSRLTRCGATGTFRADLDDATSFCWTPRKEKP